MKRKPAPVPAGRVAADPKQWSESSQGSVAAYFTTEYVDEKYKCWHCQAETTFAAADQKYTYEIRKANVNQVRRLCEPCWRESLRIAEELTSKANAWAESKQTLKDDMAFLSDWLRLLKQQETYVPLKRDTARKNMLRKLLGDA
jgi:hypothetical protein